MTPGIRSATSTIASSVPARAASISAATIGASAIDANSTGSAPAAVNSAMTTLFAVDRSRISAPTIASTVTFVVPAFAIAWGSIVLGEPIGLGLIAGFGLVIVSLVLVIGIRVGAPRLPVLSLRWPAPLADRNGG